MTKEREEKILRGDVYYADLSPVIGCEQGGIRPVIVIQNNVGNSHSSTVIVAAITSRWKKRLPTHVDIGQNEKIILPSTILLEQLRTIDKRRIHKYITTIDESTMKKVDKALKLSVGLM